MVLFVLHAPHQNIVLDLLWNEADGAGYVGVAAIFKPFLVVVDL